MKTRRDFLKIINTAALTGVVEMNCPQLFATQAKSETIKAAASNIGIRYGAHSEGDFNKSPVQYQRLFLKECALYAPNFSWPASFPQEDSDKPSWTDPNIAFAAHHSLRLTGGHIVWHQSCPKWFETSADPAAAINKYANFLASKYGNNMYSWNPVNEGINVEDGRPDGLRNSQFMKKMGPGYFKIAYDAAKQANPNILRVYNDYAMEMDNKYHADRRKALLTLLDKFKADGTPVDVVGLQSHLRLDGSKFNAKIYGDFLREIRQRGYKIFITELDVFDKLTVNASFAERDKEVANLYQQFLSVVVAEPAVKTIVSWGISDKYTWLTSKFKYVRPDGKPNRPHFFDDNMQPKQSFNVILNVLKNGVKRQLL